MNGSAFEIIQQQAKDVLQKLEAQDVVTAEQVAESVLHQTAYWEKSMPNNEKLLFVRFFSPVVQREEVFLGNILFNNFLSKVFARAISEAKLGTAELVANDLENYFFLLRTKHEMKKLAAAFRTEVERQLLHLFFADQDETRGTFGSLETMLAFEKANVEPFPVFIMPSMYAARLEKAVRESLLRKIEKSPLERNPTSIIANLAFFYCHDGFEMQSPYLFLARLALRYGIVDTNDLSQALNLKASERPDDEAAFKKIIEDSFKQKEGRSFSSTHLREVLNQAVVNLGKQTENKPDEWRMPYISDKFIPHDEKMLADVFLNGISLGYLTISSAKKAVDAGCRVCGMNSMETEDKSILLGQSTHRFHNQASKQKDKEQPKTCLRCAMCTYLMVKLIGSESVGQPQVPKTYNIIFHYGRHTDDEVHQIAHRIDTIWSLVRQRREVMRIQAEIKTVKEKLEHERTEKKKQTLAIELEHREVELQKAKTNVQETENEMILFCPWIKDLRTSLNLSENCSLDTFANLQPSESKVERHVLGLGISGYRMILFVLPQIRAPRDEKEHDFAQRRFSDSRVTVTTVLSFLRQLCGCDGPFYYQSLPTLTHDTFLRDTFYVRNESISVQKAQNEYEVVTQLAWKLVKRKPKESGQEFFTRKVLLAEKFLLDPLGTISSVMRDSNILGQSKGSFKTLSIAYRPDWKTYDLTEYAKFIQKLSSFEEVK